MKLPRRALLGGALSLAACSRSRPPEATNVTSGAAREARTEPVPQRPLGRTGVNVSLVGVGGYHLGSAGEKEGVRIVHAALDRGVTFLDNCWDYHGGKSEEIMGKALSGPHRQRAFLMTKLDGRTKQAALEQLEQSLRRLRTDVIDLVQIHEVIRADDPERCFREGGVVEALLEAQRAGKLRFVGFTGHKDPDYHLAMIAEADRRGVHFDTVQMPLNVLDAHYRSFEKKVLPVAQQKGIAVLAMKSLASGKILKAEVATPTECLHYAMNLPVSVVITGCDSMKIFDQAVEAARSFAPMRPEAVSALLARTEVAAREGKYEEFKTKRTHDGTFHNPKWLESAEI